MQKTNYYDLNVDQVAKLNKLLPKGYKLISSQQNARRIAQIKKKSKITYVPITTELKVDVQPVGRRNKSNISYYEGQGEDHGTKHVQDYEPEKIKNKKQHQFTKGRQMVEPHFPSVFSNRNLLSSKQIIQQIERHPKFYVIQKYKSESSKDNIYQNIKAKAQSPSYHISNLFSEMNELFIKIYGIYQRFTPEYNDTAELQNFLSSIISNQKLKTKEQKSEKIAKQSNSLSYPGLSRQDSVISVPSTLNRQLTNESTLKKRIVPMKADSRIITMYEKRLLGQNIKKLPNQCLPEIIKIVNDIIQTKDQYIIDIDTLANRKVKELQNYVQGCLAKLGNIDDGNDFRNEGDQSQQFFIIQDDFD